MFRDTEQALERLQSELLAEEETLEPAQPEDEELDEELLDALLQEDTRVGKTQGSAVYRNYSNDYGKELRNYASGYRAYNTDKTDEDLESYSEAVRMPQQEKGIGGLTVLALVLLAAILGVLAWCVLRWRGLI